MLWKLSVFLGLALGSQGYDYHATSYQSLIKHPLPEHRGHHGELSHIGDHAPDHHEEYAWGYPSYEFSYKVDDPYTHDNKGQHETRDGENVKGMYWLIQPDGRKRTVTYYSDKHHGFNAQVEYSDPHHKELPHYEYQQKYHYVPKPEIQAIINHVPQQHYSYQQRREYYKPQHENYYGHYY